MNSDTNDTGRLGNTKTNRVRSRKWCFTLNNYTEQELTQLSRVFDDKKGRCIIGEEVGENGTPHLQGYVEFKNARSFTTLRKINERIHWEVAYGNSEQNKDYCSKQKVFKDNLPLSIKESILIAEYSSVTWKDWQRDVLNLCKTDPHPRQINWFWEPAGNVGKSYLCKYLALIYDIIICDGKCNDVFNQVRTHMDDHQGQGPSIVIIDSPRSSENYVNYQALEKIKDGLLYSGKYEGGLCVYTRPHVFVFSNAPPDWEKLSADRWNCQLIR